VIGEPTELVGAPLPLLLHAAIAMAKPTMMAVRLIRVPPR
jgi:hypothetical protein